MEPKLPTQGRPKKRMCHDSRRRQMSWKELFPRVTIVNDPKKLAELNAELESGKLGLSQTEKQP